MKNFKDEIIDILELNSADIPRNLKFRLTIAEACLVNNCLKICFEFYHHESDQRFYRVKSFVIGSTEYMKFVYNVYFEDGCEAIAINLKDLASYSACCYGDPFEDGVLRWERIDAEELPIDSLTLRMGL